MGQLTMPIDELTAIIKRVVRQEVDEVINQLDSLDGLPETMSLSEAYKRTTITPRTMQYYRDQGLITLIKVGKGRGKLKITKTELLKLMRIR